MIIKLISFYNKYKQRLVIGSISALLAISGALFISGKLNEIKRLKQEVSVYKNNATQYQSMANGLKKDNRVLRLFTDDLRHSNDSLIVALEKLKKFGKSPGNKPGGLSAGGNTSIDAKDTIYIKNPSEFNLDTVIRYNDLTYSILKIKKDSLFSSIKVNNTQVLNVYSQREYVNTYKNKWQRFWKFDWKKEEVFRYDMINSNKLIGIDSFIVYKIEE